MLQESLSVYDPPRPPHDRGQVERWSPVSRIGIAHLFWTVDECGASVDPEVIVLLFLFELFCASCELLEML